MESAGWLGVGASTRLADALPVGRVAQDGGQVCAWAAARVAYCAAPSRIADFDRSIGRDVSAELASRAPEVYRCGRGEQEGGRAFAAGSLSGARRRHVSLGGARSFRRARRPSPSKNNNAGEATTMKQSSSAHANTVQWGLCLSIGQTLRDDS